MLDDKDKKIIDLLVSSGREPATSISEKVGLSVPSVTERIKKLQENGIISGFKAVIDYENLGFDVNALIIGNNECVAKNGASSVLVYIILLTIFINYNLVS